MGWETFPMRSGGWSDRKKGGLLLLKMSGSTDFGEKI